MKTFDEAFRSVTTVQIDPDATPDLTSVLNRTDVAVNLASSRELANELNGNHEIDVYFQAVCAICVKRNADIESFIGSVMFTVFIAGVRVGQEMEKETK